MLGLSPLPKKYYILWSLMYKDDKSALAATNHWDIQYFTTSSRAISHFLNCKYATTPCLLFFLSHQTTLKLPEQVSTGAITGDCPTEKFPFLLEKKRNITGFVFHNLSTSRLHLRPTRSNHIATLACLTTPYATCFLTKPFHVYSATKGSLLFMPVAYKSEIL